jgi:hypothetical protein
VEQLGQLLNVYVGLSALVREKLGSLRTCGLEGLDPIRRRSWHDEGYLECGVGKEKEREWGLYEDRGNESQ